MGLFAKKPAVRIADPFAVVPLRPDNVELRRDSRNMIHLRINAKIAGVRLWFAKHLGYDYNRRVELDDNGTLYYSLVDGGHTLRDIVGTLAEKTGTPSADMEQWVILFTKKLMTMNLVVLKVPPEAQLRGQP
jgi:hypothetical protein